MYEIGALSTELRGRAAAGCRRYAAALPPHLLTLGQSVGLGAARSGPGARLGEHGDGQDGADEDDFGHGSAPRDSERSARQSATGPGDARETRREPIRINSVDPSHP